VETYPLHGKYSSPQHPAQSGPIGSSVPFSRTMISSRSMVYLLFRFLAMVRWSQGSSAYEDNKRIRYRAPEFCTIDRSGNALQASTRGPLFSMHLSCHL